MLQLMKIIFKNAKVEKDFSSNYASKWKYPGAVKRKLAATENIIQQATSLQDIIGYSPFHFHPLKGNRKNEWSIYLGNTGYRVTLIPCNEKEEPIIDGDIVAQCKVIKIVLITEVSNHYE